MTHQTSALDSTKVHETVDETDETSGVSLDHVERVYTLRIGFAVFEVGQRSRDELEYRENERLGSVLIWVTVSRGIERKTDLKRRSVRRVDERMATQLSGLDGIEVWTTEKGKTYLNSCETLEKKRLFAFSTLCSCSDFFLSASKLVMFWRLARRE
jgi:hypothetical protein